MVIFLGPAALSILGGWLILRRWQPGASAPFLMLMLPFALLFVVLPIPTMSYRTILLFQGIAETGETNGTAFASGAALSLVWPLARGAAGALVVLAVAAFIGRRQATTSDSSLNDKSSPAGAVAPITWPVVLPVVLLLPACGLLWFFSGVAPLIVDASGLLTPDGTPKAELNHLVGEFSSKISARLLAGGAGGALLTALLLLLCTFNILTAQRLKLPAQLTAMARACIAVGTLGLVAFFGWSMLAIRSYRALVP